jgi:hypothetical protein
MIVNKRDLLSDDELDPAEKAHMSLSSSSSSKRPHMMDIAALHGVCY